MEVGQTVAEEENMPPQIIEVIGPLIAMGMIGTMVLLGYKMHLNAKVQTGRKDGGQDVRPLADTVEELQEQVRVLREDTAELQERMDFAERLLTQGKSEEEREAGRATPA